MKKPILNYSSKFFSFLISLLLFSSMSIAQVEIKEEVILTLEEGIDSENLTMPFYGKVTGGINWGGMWWGWLKKVVIEAGGQIVIKEVPCNGGGYVYASWGINDLPELTEVKVTVYSHCENM